MSKEIVMTEASKTVLEKYQVRKTKKQKRAFGEYIKGVAESNGYSFNTEKGYFGAENIIVGEPQNTKVIYTAHYDTCPVLPFPNFITPKHISIYLLYQIAIVLLMLAAWFLVAGTLRFALSFLGIDEFILFIIDYVVFMAIFLLLYCGPANKHTVNDNTSGVTLLLEIMEEMPISEREKVAFVFFDLEEMGMFGSMGFAAKHKRIKNNTLVINFDCVSDGENIIFALRKGAKKYRELFESSLEPNDDVNIEILDKGVFYPSDQTVFRNGVGVAALKKKGKILYMNRIHTKRDIVYREENIIYLKDRAVKITEKI